MGAALHFLSVGRFIPGIDAGSSGSAEKYSVYGYDFPLGHGRVQQLEESLQIIKAMWTEERAIFAGRHYRIRGGRCEPKPNPMPPIMVGAFGPKMLRVTAKYADW